MKLLKSHFQTRQNQKGSKGFTLIETLIAGVLLILVMTAVGRMNVWAIADSSNLAERRKVEESIENHIQLVQQADLIVPIDLP